MKLQKPTRINAAGRPPRAECESFQTRPQAYSRMVDLKDLGRHVDMDSVSFRAFGFEMTMWVVVHWEDMRAIPCGSCMASGWVSRVGQCQACEGSGVQWRSKPSPGASSECTECGSYLQPPDHARGNGKCWKCTETTR